MNLYNSQSVAEYASLTTTPAVRPSPTTIYREVHGRRKKTYPQVSPTGGGFVEVAPKWNSWLEESGMTSLT